MTRALAIISVVVGVVLGLRYKVLILVPAVMFAMLLAIIVGVARADSFWSIVLTTAVLGTAIQLGYLAGAVIRAAIASIRSGRDGGGKTDSEIGHAWQHILQLDGWAEWGSSG